MDLQGKEETRRLPLGCFGTMYRIYYTYFCKKMSISIRLQYYF